ncbi:MAG TPA: hypothetical protein DCE41_14360 [Cytophagales bacterium]|nr:hypothetical protein [Cytophagales bacterium]HAA20459.1 hypothetical protein [Cytophagales bacterium]HAP64691.1 hypothetical protein [Cytophagales bacterium]
MKKLIKFILIFFLVLIVLGGAGGYFYLKRMFQAPPNELSVTGTNSTVPIHWQHHGHFERAAAMVPVQLEGVPHTFHMQLDYGATYSYFHWPTLQSLLDRYPDALEVVTRPRDVQLLLGDITIQADSLRLRDFGIPIAWDSEEIPVLGTLGSDLLERCPMLLDFQASLLHLIPQVPDSLAQHPARGTFQFEERRVMVPIILEGKEQSMIWDTGTSAFSLMTSKERWQELTIGTDTVQPKPSNQNNRILYTYTAASEQVIELAGKQFPLGTVTYTEGFPWYIEMMYRLSPMKGLLGNAPFQESAIFLDASTETLLIL